jgi:hypothetical protein
MIDAQPDLLDDPDYYLSAAVSADTQSDILTELANRLFTIAPVEVVRRFMFGTDIMPEILKRPGLWPPSFDKAMSMVCDPWDSDLTLRVLGSSASFVINSCVPTGTIVERLVLDVRSHKDWAVLDAARVYTADGTAVHLADLVLAAKHINGMMLSYSFVEGLPWPAAACLVSAQESGTFEEIAAALRAGKMGNLEDWMRWEDSWKRGDLTWSSFASPHDESLPFIADSWLAAPLIAVQAYRGDPGDNHENVWSTVAEATRVAQQLRDPVGRSAVLTNATFDLWRRGRGEELPRLPPSQEVFAVLSALLHTSSSVLWITQGLLSRIDVSAIDDNEVMDAYVELVHEAIVRDDGFRAQKFSNEAVSVFRLAVARNPNLVGLLIPISLRAADPRVPFSPFDIDTHRQRLPQPLAMRDEAAMTLILARQGRLLERDIPGLAVVIERLGSDFLDELMGALEGGVGGIDAETLLIGLHARLQFSAKESVRDAALEELSERVRERKTCLSAGAEWARLGLPRELLDLCK